MPKLIEELNVWQRSLLDKEVKSHGYHNRISFLSKTNFENWTNGVSVNTSDFNSFEITFRVYGEKRNLFITHTCSNDHSEIRKGEKIIFDLGYWGMSEEIMLEVAKIVKKFGDVYYDYNDCDNEPFIKL